MWNNFSLVSSLALIALVLGGFYPVNADEPTDSGQLEQARSQEGAKQKEINALNAQLDHLQEQVDASNDRAVKLLAETTLGNSRLAVLQTRLADLASRQALADQRARQSASQLTGIVSGLYQGDFLQLGLGGIWLSNSPDLLYRLSMLNRLAANLSAIENRAVEDRNINLAIKEQTQVAQTDQAQTQQAINLSREEAQKALQQAGQELASQKLRTQTLYAQLAALKQTTIAQEKKDRQKLEEQRVFAQQQRLAQLAAEKAKKEQEKVQTSNPSPPAVALSPSPTPATASPSPAEPDDPLARLALTGSPRRAEAKAYAKKRVIEMGWPESEYKCLEILWTRESSWRWNAYNFSSGAYGIPQALPGSKMALSGADWMTNQDVQINWGLSYISARYGSPCKAWDFWQGRNWY